jgi:hypothetical protein
VQAPGGSGGAGGDFVMGGVHFLRETPNSHLDMDNLIIVYARIRISEGMQAYPDTN